MKTYWDLSDKARSVLSQAQVQEFAAAELMSAGVIRAGALVLVDEPEMPEPDGEVYVLNRGWSSQAVAWATADEAGQSVAGALGVVESKNYGDYSHATTIKFVKPFEDLSVRTVSVYSQRHRDDFAELIKRAAEARAENSKRRAFHDEAEKAERDALAGMWEDWAECCERARSVGAVLATRDEYVAMLDGDTTKAREFLHKAYNFNEVSRAEAWEAEA